MWTEGRVVRQHAWTDTLSSIYIEADIDPFTAGQFCRIALDIDEKKVPRPYSFVNAPHEKVLEFYYIQVSDGLFTPKLAALKEGDPIWVAKKGAGIFTLKQVQEADTLWMFATGTALGVFLSILKTEDPWRRFKNIVLVHAVRYSAELSHQDLISNFALNSKFRYVPFVSREACDKALPGRIPAAIEDGRLEAFAQLPLSPEGSCTMLCGNPHMVQDMLLLLKEKGFKPSSLREPGQITIENYWKD